MRKEADTFGTLDARMNASRHEEDQSPGTVREGRVKRGGGGGGSDDAQTHANEMTRGYS